MSRFIFNIVSKHETILRKEFTYRRVGSQELCFRLWVRSEMGRKNPYVRAQNHKKHNRGRQHNPRSRKVPNNFLKAREWTTDISPWGMNPEMFAVCLQNELFNFWEKSDWRRTKRTGEGKIVLCQYKAFVIQNREVNETTLPSVSEHLAELAWNFLIRVVRLGLAVSCFLGACPCGGFSKSKWGFKPIQFNWHKSCQDTSDAWGEQVFLATRP